MSYINTNNYFNSMFSTRNTTNTNNSLSNMLGDYASIKSGSYKKLLKSYYAKQAKAEQSENTEDTVKEKNKLSQIKSDSSQLTKDASALYADKSLFEKKYMTVKDKDGNKTTVHDYDMDTIKKKVKSFVESYNDVIDSASEADATSVLRPALNATKRTKANARLLDKVGISIEDGNKLKLDEEAFDKAAISDLKSLFSGVSSYAYWTGSNASAISNAASGELSDSSLYTGSAVKYPEINSSTIEDYI